ncbi:hypothetical protein ACQPZX_18750 [Actinoplanes sp. CA-142083]|uniref:hypothetical protein n=1 Tax=Actinoplanes sp. CA-142083 TaxID=3239903 RepID=UPI003D920B80
MALLAGAATGEAEDAWTNWHEWQLLSGQLSRLYGISVAVSDTGGPYVEAGVLVGAALLGTTLTVLACARLSATEDALDA